MIKKMLVIIAGIFMVSSTLAEAGQPFFGTVKNVIDGDSLLITSCGRNIEVRLYGVDTPEYNQPYAEEAKKFNRQWVGWQQVQVQPEYVDSYGRTVAIIFRDGKVLNEDLVQAGLAWVYPRFCRRDVCKTWQALEGTARTGKKGLWHDPHPMSPWKWKRRGER